MPVPVMTSSRGTTRIIMPTFGGESFPSKKKKKDENVKKPNTRAENAKTETKPVETKPAAEADSHGIILGVVYANDLAQGEINKENPGFPVGSIIVREKLSAGGATPEIVIAMVKREKGFSKKTGDWEFFVFDGKDFALKERETVGSCSACHASAEKTDWVFRDYLK